jgi:imidazoleglycerol phosphate synthase glutamine amidotransferase subunit HisH
MPEPRNTDWVLATTDYGSPFVAAVGKGNIYATQVQEHACVNSVAV